tara:strand:+ start:384 stop:1292 length:909 start_codon:yes stop_codon:yes gene_type:complete
MRGNLNQKNINLFRDLYRVAVSDGRLADEEIRKIYEIGHEYGVQNEEIEKGLLKPIEPENLPSTDKEIRAYLYDVVRLILSDNYIHPKEIEAYRSIAKRLIGDEPNAEITQDFIFEKIASDFIAQQRKRFDELENRVQVFFGEDRKAREEDLQSEDRIEFEKTKEELVSEPTKERQEIERRTPVIVVFGHSQFSRHKIQQFIISALERRGVEIAIKNIICSVEYGKAKGNSNVAITRLERATCDLFIYGPTPHSIKGKSINDSWEDLVENGSVFIRGYQKKPISKTNLIKWLDEFCDHWCKN